MKPLKSIADILNYLCESGADPMIVRPATDKDIEMCNEDFIEFCEKPVVLPDEYVKFLKHHNGFAWNSIELFSTDRVTDTRTDYMLNDIVSENEDFQDHYEPLSHCLYFGRASEEMYLYNPTKDSKRWERRDITSWRVMEEHDSFEEFFVAVVGNRWVDAWRG